MQDNEVMVAYEETPMSDVYAQSEYFKKQMEEEEEKDKSSGIKFEKYETVISNPDNSTVKIKKNSAKIPYWVVAVLALTIVFPFVLHYGTKTADASAKDSLISRVIALVSDKDAKTTEPEEIIEAVDDADEEANEDASSYEVAPANLKEGMNHEEAAYNKGIAYLRDGKYDEAASIFLAYPKVYNRSNYFFSIQSTSDYSVYIPSLDKDYKPKKTDLYWAVMNVDSGTCHLVYMYDEKDSEDFSYFWVHDIERGNAYSDSTWYLFDKDGTLLEIDNY